MRAVSLSQNPPIVGRYFVFKWFRDNRTEAVLYWRETSIFKINSESEQKHVKISVITYPLETDSIEELKDELVFFGETIAGSWEPIKVSSEIVFLLSENGQFLLFLVFGAIIAILIYEFFYNIKVKRKNSKALEKISKDDKTILKTVSLLKKPRTNQNIIESFEKITNQKLLNSELMERLQKAKKAGFVEKILINFHDQPILGWKPKYSLN